jgi:hypothetical protein
MMSKNSAISSAIREMKSSIKRESKQSLASELSMGDLIKLVPKIKLEKKVISQKIKNL